MTEQITCECGWIIKGNSAKHTEANLKIHKKSKAHKMLMINNAQLKKEVEKK